MDRGELVVSFGGVDLKVVDSTIWATTDTIAQIFLADQQVVVAHIQDIISEHELDERIVRDQNLYNLDMVIAVSFRTKSKLAIAFRQWAMQILREYMVKGFAMDDERLKQVNRMDYFDELMERIRSIRASEPRLNQALMELFSTAVDFDPNSDEAKYIFAKITDKVVPESDKIIVMYLDYAEDQCRRRKTTSMADWLVRLDLFFEFISK